MIPDRIKQMMIKLETAGFEVYIIGGAVRDYYLGLTPYDWDLFTNATGEEIKKVFPQGVVIGGEERQKKILTVVVDGVEISQYRSNGARTALGHSLTTHQATCDFTINSIAMDKDMSVTDPNNGIRDIWAKQLRFVGNADDRIKEDPLRILRGYRFMCKYGMKDIDKALDKNIMLLHDLPKERVSTEMLKILSIPNPCNNTKKIILELIKSFIKEMDKCIGMPGGDHHNEVVDVHMCNALTEAFKITNNPLLRLTAFLHDIGKGVTQSFVEDDKQTHFYEHEKKGSEIVEDWMTEFKFSNEAIKYVSTLIRLHMYSYKDEPSKKSYIKFFNKLNDAKIPIEDYVMLIYCDHQGNMNKPRIKFGDFIKGNFLYKEYQKITYSEEPMTIKDLKVSGKDVMEVCNMKPGLEIGVVLKELFNNVMDGTIKNTRAELLNSLKYWSRGRVMKENVRKEK